MLKLPERKINMFKKILCLALALLMVSPVYSVFAEDNMGGILELLSEFKIMEGDGNGNFRLDDAVTRAEFTKVAVASSAYRNSVPYGISVSPFSDVPYTHWSAPYVKVALSNKVVSGYPDGTFKPSKLVTYEEGLTIMLNLLGYTALDFGSSWPSGQIGLAKNIELSKNVNKTQGQNLSRRDVAYLAYNLMNIKPKGGNSKYISAFEWSVIEDTTLISDSGEDNTILTGDGSYKASESFVSTSFGSRGNLYLNKSGKASYFVVDATEKQGEKYVVYSVLKDAVITYDNGKLSELKLTGDTVTYVNSVKTGYSSAKNQLSMGDALYVKRDKNNKIDYISVETQEMEGPVRVTTGSWYTALGVKDLSSVTVMRDSMKVSPSSLQTNDIVYYSSELNMIFAYNKKVTGIYENAVPNRDNPSSVKISGTEYDIEGVSAYNALSSAGEFKLGDTVTLLLGKDGSIADVLSASEGGDSSVYGFLTASSLSERDLSDDGNKSTVYTAEVVLPNGSKSSYTVKKDCKDYIGKMVKISFDGGMGNVSAITENNTWGTFSYSNMTLGNTKVSENVRIIDTAEAEGSALYTSTYPQRLDGLDLSSDKVLYCEKNSDGEIDVLYLNNATGDMFLYGVITNAPSEGSASGMYSCRAGADTYSWSQSAKSFTLSPTALAKGAGARLTKSGMGITYADSLFPITSIRDINKEYLVTDSGEKHMMSGSVSVYKKHFSNDYMLVTFEEFESSETKNLRAYYDGARSDGGRIRVVIYE